MGGVFANGLEISGKSVDAKTIAAFPDVCFTPPENPATPPGVPVPYPSFGMAGDTEQGTATVLIGGKTVNIKNKSDLSKTSGTEAGCAAKKGVITSKNTGKGYFNSWSNDVKFDGEPVIRMTDLATNNHASPTGNTVTWPHVAKLTSGDYNCETVLNELGIHLHKHGDNPCGSMQHEGKQLQSEHIVMNAFSQNNRSQDVSIAGMGKYSCKGAPCICMQGPGNAQPNSTHGNKTMRQNALIANLKESKTQPTLGKVIDHEIESIGQHHENLKKSDDQEKNNKIEAALDCLKQVVEQYFEWVTGKEKKEMRETEVKMPYPNQDFPAPPNAPSLPPTQRVFG
jgi:hypothetical protein